MQHDARTGGSSVTPGRLIYLMGPSGSGKDSVIDQARAELKALGVPVARRVITRSAEAVGEEAHSVSLPQFLALRERGAFALDWQANGLHYGIPAGIDGWLAAGRWVLVNGSRAHLPSARLKYPDLLPILLVVDPGVLLGRLVGRGRESAEEIEQRLARNDLLPDALDAEIRCLDNSTTLADAAQRLLSLLRAARLPRQNE